MPPRLPAGLQGSRPDALLLDFDGVIVDSVGLKIAAYLEIYRDAPQEMRQAVVAHHHAHGGMNRGVRFAILERELFGRTPTADDIASMSCRYGALVKDAVVECRMIPGASEFLDAARGQSAMHVISGTPQGELEEIVRRRGLARYFATLHGAPATKPLAFRQILDDYGYRPARVVAIGDATTEFEAARALGIAFLGVVAPTEPNMFPPDVPVVPTLEGVAAALGFS